MKRKSRIGLNFGRSKPMPEKWITVGKYRLNPRNISYIIKDEQKKKLVIAMVDGYRIEVREQEYGASTKQLEG